MDTGAGAGAGAAGRRARLALAVLRVLTSLVWLSNGAAKALGVRAVDLGFFRADLIDLPGARSILRGAARTTDLPLLRDAALQVARSGWPIASVLLTVAELAIGLGLLLGVLTRWAAIGGLLLLAPVWLMTWPGGGYLWDYPGDLVPLLVLAIAGRAAGGIVRRRGRAAPRALRRTGWRGVAAGEK